MKIGQFIYAARKKNNISQEELANKLDVSRQSISLWETDQTTPTLDKLEAMCNILNVSFDELLGKKTIASKNQYKKEKKQAIIKVIEKVCLALSILSVLFWMKTAAFSFLGILLSLFNVRNKEGKYFIYTLIVCVVFFIATVTCS